MEEKEFYRQFIIAYMAREMQRHSVHKYNGIRANSLTNELYEEAYENAYIAWQVIEPKKIITDSVWTTKP